ncbi:hypothetical protein BVC80_8807g13 [Macleaya cordata]|uniref:Uncharacterized protein n=1 Tax=Macleaya cordata TaxID=56857 RepID=A0A200R812_MACCD|nr:hypothetical protein BVC80_8807g13 [Macleaya cordata]
MRRNNCEKALRADTLDLEQGEARRDGYTGVLPYLYGVFRSVRRRWGFQKLGMDEQQPFGFLNRRFRIAGLAVMFSRKGKKTARLHAD